MLVELAVENYAVVEKVRVRFHRGLNLLTGETGSGKSIVVDALALLFGGRASAEMVRTGAERARVSGIFEVDADNLPEGVELEDGEIIVEREILRCRKAKAQTRMDKLAAAHEAIGRIIAKHHARDGCEVGLLVAGAQSRCADLPGRKRGLLDALRC